MIYFHQRSMDETWKCKMCPVSGFFPLITPKRFGSIRAFKKEFLYVSKTHPCCDMFVNTISKKSLSSCLHPPWRKISLWCVWMWKIKTKNILYCTSLLQESASTLLFWLWHFCSEATWPSASLVGVGCLSSFSKFIPENGPFNQQN